MKPRRPFDPVGLVLWLLPLLAAAAMAVLMIRPVWTMTDWLR